MLQRKTYWSITDEKKKAEDNVIIKDFDTFMYYHTLHHEKNFFIVIVYKLLAQKKY